MKYFIIGNGGFAKEVLFLSKEVFGSLNDFSGFIDYKPNLNRVQCMGGDYLVIDENEFLGLDKMECSVFLGIGDPKRIKKVTEKFTKYNFPNLIHPNVIMDKSVILGSGNIITAGCILTVDIVIGNYNVINLSTTIGHDTQIKNHNVFNPSSNISGAVSVGNGNLFGTNSTVLQGIRIGDNSIIGAGSLINKNVDSNLVVVGVPGKAIKSNE